ncbi:hypothetical protein GMMP1_950003 [Candidatus Magnetomoraceae bacterium gMMP-1]
MKIKKVFIMLPIAILNLITFVISSYALEHFTGVVPTPPAMGKYAGKVTIDGIKAENNHDEIGVFVSDGSGGELIVGACLLSEIVTDHYFVNVYKEDIEPGEQKNGAIDGEELFFKVWDKSDNKEYTVFPFSMTYEISSGLSDPSIPPVFASSEPTWGLLNLNALLLDADYIIKESGGSRTAAQSQELSITNSGFLVDIGDSIKFGHNSSGCAQITTDLTGTNLNSRLSREWYFDINDENSNGGNIQITFNFGDNHPTVGASDYFLIYRADTESAYSKTINSTPASYTTPHTVVFDDVDISELSDGYYTLGCTYENLVVTLSSFIAIPFQNNVLLQWETATEIDNVGFYILRSNSENGQYIRINENVIPTKGLGVVSGAAYYYEDKNVVTGQTYYYKLEDIADDGTVTLHEVTSSGEKGVTPGASQITLDVNEDGSFNLADVIYLLQLLTGIK